jgi:hypothetical protein
MIKINKDWKFSDKYPSIGAYTTTHNCVTGGYPFIESIKSFSWCDNVYVADSSDDVETKAKLEQLVKDMPNLQVFDAPENTDPGRDGIMKTLSRAMVVDEFCLQFDCDEFCVGSVGKWKKLTKTFPDNESMMTLFVAEPIGSMENLRTDKNHNYWKWRLSKNLPEIVHGIPAKDQKKVDGKIYSLGGSDGCFPCNVISDEMISHFAHKSVLELARARMKGLDDYLFAVNKLIEDSEPFVLHVGHVDLKSKIKLYLSSWHKWWCGLYGVDVNDANGNLYFPGTKVEDVTDEMIDSKVEEILFAGEYVKCEALKGLIKI